MTNNPRLLVGLSALHFALFPIPVVTLFWTEQIGMSLTDVMTLQAGFSVAIVLCEFPSGYLADRIGYRASLVIGGVGWLAGWLVYAWASSFGAVMLAEVILGVGLAFMSGADRALLWASLEATGRADQYTRWDGPGLPFWLEIPVAALGLTSIVALREIPRPARTPHRSHLERAWHVLRFALGHNARLRATLTLSVALGLSSFVMVWVIQPYMRGRGMPPTWFGPVWAGAHAWLALVSLASARIVGALGVRATVLGCCLLIPLGYAGLSATTTAAGVIFYLAFMTLRGLQGPILACVMQEEAPHDDRASVLSLAALLFRLSFVIVGPPVGALIDRLGMDAALALLGMAFTVVSLAAFFPFARAHEQISGRAVHG